jgi:hypothetical protein
MRESMDRALPMRIAGPALVLVAASLALPTLADGKVTCETQRQVTELPGLPTSPEPGRSYELTIDLSAEPAANPRPLVLAQRCERPESAQLLGNGVLFRGSEAPEGGAAITVEFPRPGLWHVVSMDVSGLFRDHGFYTVEPKPASATTQEANSPGAALIAAGAAAGLLGLVFAIGRVRRRMR